MHRQDHFVRVAGACFVLIGGQLAEACGSDSPTGAQCIASSDCSTNFSCVDGLCTQTMPPTGQRADASGFRVDAAGLGYDAGPASDAGRVDASRDDADAGSVCGPAACDAVGAVCGALVDGCGGTVDCGGCPNGFACGTGPFANQCRCQPRSCDAQGAQCGPLDDGCGVMLDCGGCPNNQMCGVVATNQCGCPNGQRLCDGQCVTRCGQTYATAGMQTHTIPGDCSVVRVVAWGAGGGHGTLNTRAAAGGFARADFDVRPGRQLTVVVGGAGGAGRAGGGAAGAPGVGGRGGVSGNSQGGGGGGGLSGIFNGTLSQGNAWLVAGGGAGSGGETGGTAGAGGGTTGQNGDANGGTQTTGGQAGGTLGGGVNGAALRGGRGGDQNSGDGGGGGGGGYFGGGGGGGANSGAAGGGGGSGHISSDGRNPQLTQGNRGTPGAASNPLRGTAGSPQRPGLVAIDCL